MVAADASEADSERSFHQLDRLLDPQVHGQWLVADGRGACHPVGIDHPRTAFSRLAPADSAWTRPAAQGEARSAAYSRQTYASIRQSHGSRTRTGRSEHWLWRTGYARNQPRGRTMLRRRRTYGLSHFKERGKRQRRARAASADGPHDSTPGLAEVRRLRLTRLDASPN
jgi:hypothetical protein